MAVLGADDGGAGQSESERAAKGLRALIVTSVAISLVGLVIVVTIPAGQELLHSAGIVTVVMVAAAILAAAFGPIILERNEALGQRFSRFGRRAWPIASAFARLDAFVREVIGPAIGLKSRRWWIRYPILIAWLTVFGALAYFSNVYGQDWDPKLRHLIVWAAMCLSFLALLTVVRCWFWNESLIERAGDGDDDIDTERIADLRDEALVAVLLFFAALPIAMKLLSPPGAFVYCTSAEQFYSQESCPSVQSAVSNPSIELSAVDEIVEWYSFFGSELLRAVPLVDWAEVYDFSLDDGIRPARAGTSQSNDENTAVRQDENNQDSFVRTFSSYAGYHIAFVVRVAVDLILLAALLHALERVSRISRQRREFYDKKRTIVDPYLENKFIGMIIDYWAWDRGVEPNYIGNWAEYDEGCLRRLAARPRPEVRALAYHTAIADVRKVKELDLLTNRFAGVNGVARERDKGLRQLIVQLLQRPGVDGRRALEAIASGLGSERGDNSAEQRLGAINAIVELGADGSIPTLLQVLATESNGNVRKAVVVGIEDIVGSQIDIALQNAAVSDRNRTVRTAARNALRARGVASS